jgi:hypothetical protein
MTHLVQFFTAAMLAIGCLDVDAARNRSSEFQRAVRLDPNRVTCNEYARVLECNGLSEGGVPVKYWCNERRCWWDSAR